MLFLAWISESFIFLDQEAKNFADLEINQKYS